MENLSRLLRRLLHDPRFRASFRAGLDSGEPGEPAALAADFAHTDWDQLAAFGERIERQVFSAPLFGDRALPDLFTETIRAIAPTDFRGDFLLSDEYVLATDVPSRERGPSLEEAFYHFVRTRFPALERSARHEFLCAHLQSVAIYARPSFLPSCHVRPLRDGFASVQRFGQELWLYALVGSNLVAGPVGEEVVEILERYFWGERKVEAVDLPLVEALRSLGFATAI